MSKEISFEQLFTSILRFVKKNFFIMLIAVLVGVGLGFVKSFTTPPLYETGMTVFSRLENEYTFENEKTRFSSFYSGEIVANKIKTLQTALDNSNYEYISKELGMSVDSVKLLKEIEVEFLYPIEGTRSEKYVKEIDYFNVNVKFSDNSILPKLEKGFKKMVENDKFIKTKLEEIKSMTRKMIADIDNEILEIDKAKNDLKGNKNTLYFGNEKSLYAEKIDLIAKRMEFQKKLNQYTAFSVMTGFVPSYSNKNGYFINSIVFGLLAFVFSIFYLIVRDLSRKDLN